MTWPRFGHRLAKWRIDYFLGGVSDQHRRGLPVPPPQYVLWDCSRRCNLSCLHCGAVKEHYPNELSTDRILALIDELAALRVRMFAVTGGEPLLRSDLLDVLAHASNRGLFTGVATNGYQIDHSMARRLRAAGVDTLQISLDGLEDTHNQIRGDAESFARATAGARLLVAAGLPLVSAATTVTPRNIDELDRLREVVRQAGFSEWRLSVVMPIGRAEGGDLLLDAAGLERLFAFVARHDSPSFPILIGENLPFLGKWERRARRAPMPCPVGFSACCIGVDGQVRGCPEQPDTPEWREGSILQRPFAAIWQEGFARYRERILRHSDPECARCRQWHDCYGGCWVMRRAGQHCIKGLLG